MQEYLRWLESSRTCTAMCVRRVERLSQTSPSRSDRPVPSVHIKDLGASDASPPWHDTYQDSSQHSLAFQKTLCAQALQSP
jgi:hypothetical protein